MPSIIRQDGSGVPTGGVEALEERGQAERKIGQGRKRKTHSHDPRVGHPESKTKSNNKIEAKRKIEAKKNPL